ncbi:hypothetical protein D1AOALGA4SA_4648 [Olavius algarvensis Delta 1 endosymbiont]|nr:hypothetical protein D1AOALGA4SA_4648 [Olavius algarvensis Delta 1 endosymbiont]
MIHRLAFGRQITRFGIHYLQTINPLIIILTFTRIGPVHPKADLQPRQRIDMCYN